MSLTKNLASKYFKWTLMVDGVAVASGDFADSSIADEGTSDTTVVSDLTKVLIPEEEAITLDIGATDNLVFYIWLENDDGCKNVCHRITLEDMVATQNPKHCEKDFCRDEVLLEGLEERIAKLKGNTVIVLHTMGSHGPTYYKRYTDDFKKFQPTCDTSDLQKCSKEEIVNTYDNTILYTDFIISSVIDILKKFPQYETGLIYMSDHGESLGENNLYLHGLPYAIAPDEQTKVPFLVWLSPQLKQAAKLDTVCLKKDARLGSYSHDNLFHSILGLLDIQTKVYNPKLDVFQNCEK